ncbi:MAG: 7-cyano-7-deazaguanine synthase QueC [Vulcanimicrobiaceae bacterium]
MVSTLDPNSALVLFSGGQDSTTCLAWALARFHRVQTIGFDYGQRHRVELSVRPKIIESLRSGFPDWATRLADDRVLHLDLSAVSASALFDPSLDAIGRPDGIPSTFVPGRNLLFLLYAGIFAEQRGLKHVVIGACETDYSGYPDCRDDTIKALQVAMNLGLQSRIVLHSPLMWIDKAETWAMARDLGGDDLVSLILEQSHTCYAGDRLNRHEWGYGCDACDACRLRAKGWRRFVQVAVG